MKKTRILRNRLNRRALVTLKTSEAFSGVLYEVDAQALVLREAESIDGTRTNIAVDGEIVILRADVAYVQLP